MNRRSIIKDLIAGKEVNKPGLWIGRTENNKDSFLLKKAGVNNEEGLHQYFNDDVRWITPHYCKSTYQNPKGISMRYWKEVNPHGLNGGLLAKANNLSEIDKIIWPQSKYLNFDETLNVLKKTGEDRFLLKKCVFHLRQFKDAFHDMNWQPFIKTEIEGVYVNQWHENDKTVFTVYNGSGSKIDDILLQVDYKKGLKYYDVWKGKEITTIRQKDQIKIPYEMDNNDIGCILVQPEKAQPPYYMENPVQLVESNKRRSPSISDVKPNTTTKNWQYKNKLTTEGMIKIPGGIASIGICHNVSPKMEGACYGDISTRHSKNHAEQTIYLHPYYIDKTEVTNSMYKVFLDSSHYYPSEIANFLKHWDKPENTANEPWLWKIPNGLENHPVVWVDHDDARAYAQWYGKRLPTEEEWQYAAQGPDGLTWPWGNEFDKNKCNGNSDKTLPVGSFENGASPFGCLDMCGNVWEYTYKVWDDGHTKYTLLRGGSYFKTDGSIWYPASGAQPNQSMKKCC